VASVAEILVKYLADTSGLSKATGDIDAAGGKVKKSMSGVAKAVGTGLAVGAVVAFGKSAVGAAEDSEKATNRLEQVFRSMGDSTGEAAKGAEEYASALSQKTAIEDESIMAAQALLATFDNVSNATARQAGIYDRATAAAADLAAAGFGSLESNATQLGKALNDPVKGLTALARSGVTFTESQKEQIKALTESGHLLDAQKIALAAIEHQVKGTAAATATESEKMSVAFGETEEALGKALLPALAELAPILAKVAGFIADNSSVIVPLAGVLLGLVVVIKAVTTAQLLWNLAMTANPIGLIIVGIGALIVAIVLLVKNWDSVVAALKKGWDLIKQAAVAVFDWFKANWPLLLGILAGPFGLAVALIVKHWDAIKTAVRNAVEAVKGFITGLGAAIAAWVTNAAGALVRLAEKFGAPVDAARAMVGAIKELIGSIASYIDGQVGRIASAIARVVDAIKRPINAVLSGWNAITFSIPTISLPSVTIAGKKIGGGEFGGQSFGVPKIPLLAGGGVVSSPTLLVAGEAGREIIAPENLLRSIMREQAVQVRVFIGDRELTDMVRVELANANTGLARTLLAGQAAV
jgi:phage-related protein